MSTRATASRAWWLGLGVMAWAIALGPPVAAGTGVLAGRLTAKNPAQQKNAVVYVEGVPGALSPPTKPVRLDQRNQVFLPFVLPIVKGTTVEFLNSDNTGHNIFSPDGERYDLGTWPKGETRTYRFDKEGVYTQLCKLHPSMIAYIVVLSTPYFGVTGEDGSFRIPNLPPGTYKLRVWHERKKATPVDVSVSAGKESKVEIALGK